jgi:RNA polymerase sigma-70 factor (ECF subfamily)
MAYRTLGDLDAAHDAAQEAFVAAWRAIPRFRGDAAFSTWFFRILHNLCLDHAKRRERSRELPLDKRGDDDPAVPEVPDPGRGPAEETERAELHAQVHAALARLPAHFRLILTMFDIEGMSYGEIGAILRVPTGTVKSRLNRARHALRRQLAPAMEQLAARGSLPGQDAHAEGGGAS